MLQNSITSHHNERTYILTKGGSPLLGVYCFMGFIPWVAGIMETATCCSPRETFLPVALRWRHNARGGLTIVYSTVHSGTDKRKHQSSASLAHVRWINRWPVNSPHKGPVMRKCFHFITSSWEDHICRGRRTLNASPRCVPLTSHSTGTPQNGSLLSPHE